MKINLIAVGKKMPDWIQTGIHHYQKQLPASLNFNLIALEAQKRKGKNNEQIKELEGELLIKATKGSNLTIAFDERSKQHSTKSMTHFLSNWQKNGDNIALLIGGV
ncbi:23S rRNA (pseudouridine(1915)-N(3))-methyltransferase RlmH [Abyssogena phaseoliformis symbiont]|uniref:23S rRNA (pseudouridine(1915)-N(3))-methyltransferase RlmH n=1 Tax=Abyssogena phaseoliformis symbiont TaxID=596095 RepID=UPI00247B12ED|nr:23S rRNA (pseudouridine(1915)-N(3))-methyltransferase RlmH [Abyssogena phaseoliformis symbiont]